MLYFTDKNKYAKIEKHDVFCCGNRSHFYVLQTNIKDVCLTSSIALHETRKNGKPTYYVSEEYLQQFINKHFNNTLQQ